MIVGMQCSKLGMSNRNIYKAYKVCKMQARASITCGNNLRHGKVATNQNAHHERRRRMYKLQVHPSRMAKFSVLKMFENKQLQQDCIITTRHIKRKLQGNPSRMSKFSVLKMFECARMQQDYIITIGRHIECEF